MQRPRNEGKACDAVVRALEHLVGTKRENSRSPEKLKLEPPLEFVCDIGSSTYGFEHTELQSFDQQIKSNWEFFEFSRDLSARINLQNLSGEFQATFSDRKAWHKLMQKNSHLQADLVSWIEREARRLFAECPVVPSRREAPDGHKDFVEGTFSGKSVFLSFQTGWRVPPRNYGRLFIGRYSPEDPMRRNSVHVAIEKKSEKLTKWKASKTDRSVLIMENRYLGSLDLLAICDELDLAPSTIRDRLDEIWLVETSLEDRWTAYCLMKDGESLPYENSANFFMDFDPKNLDEICR